MKCLEFSGEFRLKCFIRFVFGEFIILLTWIQYIWNVFSEIGIFLSKNVWMKFHLFKWSIVNYGILSVKLYYFKIFILIIQYSREICTKLRNSPNILYIWLGCVMFRGVRGVCSANTLGGYRTALWCMSAIAHRYVRMKSASFSAAEQLISWKSNL